MNIIFKNPLLFFNGKLRKFKKFEVSDIVSDLNDFQGKSNLEIEARDLAILPGLIDPHVHIRDFELAFKEDFLTGSKAAAKGGFVYFIDMPNTMPPVLDSETLEKRKQVAKKSIIDCGFHFGASARDNTQEIVKAFRDKKVHSLKIYLNHTTGDLLIEDEKLLDKMFAIAPLVSVHAEDEKVELAIKLAKKHHTKLYLCHISQESELQIIKKYKKTANDPIFVEVTPHHLFLDQDLDKDGFTKMRPPLRNKRDQQSLWAAIESGLIDTIGSDHAGHTKQEKQSSSPPFGVPGLETTTPLLIDAYNKGMIRLEKLVFLLSQNSAKIFGLNYLGKLDSKHKTNLTIIDLNLTKTLKNNTLKTKCGWSPFDNWELKGWPIMTIAQGKIVFGNL
ncbi:MAG: amidohydrolase family protein [Candidatus Moranbacteria bacterium]|nr:amidohydrolase family protein [Candidatus Moranbacteria bacterium]